MSWKYSGVEVEVRSRESEEENVNWSTLRTNRRWCIPPLRFYLFLVYLAESVGGGQFIALANQRTWRIHMWIDSCYCIGSIIILPSMNRVCKRNPSHWSDRFQQKAMIGSPRQRERLCGSGCLVRIAWHFPGWCIKVQHGVYPTVLLLNKSGFTWVRNWEGYIAISVGTTVLCTLYFVLH